MIDSILKVVRGAVQLIGGTDGTIIGNTTDKLKVDGSGVTQPVSAAALPLPTGAATAALQTQPGVDIGDVTINNASGASAVNIQDGGNSITVDGPLTDTQLRATAVPISGIVTAVTNSQNSFNSFTLSAANTGSALNVAGQQMVMVRLSGTWVATVKFRISPDAGTNYTEVAGIQLEANSDPTSTVTTNGVWLVPVGGSANIQVWCSAYTSGTINASIQIGYGNNTTYVRALDGSGYPLASVTDTGVVSENVRALLVRPQPHEHSTFVAVADAVALGNQKHMISLLNATGSTKIVRIRSLRMINVQTAAVTGVVTDFRFYRMTGHSGGTQITPQSYDTNDTLNANITVRTGGTIAGLFTPYMMRYVASSDEWGVGTADVESFQNSFQSFNNILQQQQNCKSIVVRENQGVTLRCETNTTAGTFLFELIFTEEPV